MTTIFTLPIAEFPRIVVPDGGEPEAETLLQSKMVFPIMFGVTLVVAVPLIAFAFKIDMLENYGERLLRFWKQTVEREVEKAPPRLPMPPWLRGSERVQREAVKEVGDESD